MFGEEAAHAIVYGAGAVGVCLWVWGYVSLRQAELSVRDAGGDGGDDFDKGTAPDRILATGTVEINGEIADPAARTAKWLAGGGLAYIGMVRIVGATNERVDFEVVQAGSMDRRGTSAGGRGPWRGEVAFRPMGAKSFEAKYKVEVPTSRWLLFAGRMVSGIGAVAIVAILWGASAWLAGSKNPAVRGQVLQVIQIGHFLWPPFLFAALFRARHRQTKLALEAFLGNLPYMD